MGAWFLSLFFFPLVPSPIRQHSIRHSDLLFELKSRPRSIKVALRPQFENRLLEQLLLLEGPRDVHYFDRSFVVCIYQSEPASISPWLSDAGTLFSHSAQPEIRLAWRQRAQFFTPLITIQMELTAPPPFTLNQWDVVVCLLVSVSIKLLQID